jgi:type I restriction enzyme S subunit
MSWQKIKLGDFLINREGRYKPNDLKIKGLKRIEKIDFSGKIFLSDKASNTDMILVKKGDLVISGINVEKGAMNVYEGDEDVIATIHYSSYQFDENKIDVNFLKHFLKSLEFKKALKEQVPGGIKTEIKPKHILPLLVNFPIDLKDQKQVVKKLDNNNNTINNISLEVDYQLTLIKQLRQAFLREAMQGHFEFKQQHFQDGELETGAQLLEKIKAEKAQLIKEGKLKKEKPLPPITADEIPFEIPEHWTWCRLGEVIELISGQDLKPSQYSETNKQGLPYITGASNLQNGEVIINRWTNDPKSFAFQNDLLLTCKGSGVGKMAYLNIEKVHIARQIMAVKSQFINLKYVQIILQNNVEFFKKNAKSLIPGIDRSQVLNIMTPLPPLHKQNQIVAKLDELMAFCDDLEKSIKESQDLNEILLQEVLREALQGEEVNA